MKQCDYIFQMQRLSVNDGEGIRTTIFLKGCRLRCRWCANPESWRDVPQVMFFAHKCISCGKCITVCPSLANNTDSAGRIFFHNEKCKTCGHCLQVCPVNARQMMGTYFSADEVMDQLKKDMIFFDESGGGVTFSGGEPFLHTAYLRALIKRCGQLGISTAAESCGYFDAEACKDIIAAMDMIFFDIKMMNSIRHKKYTGIGNEEILHNIAAAAQINDNIVIRVPLIKNINTDKQNFAAMIDFLRENSLNKVELLPYHILGYEKMRALGMSPEKYSTPVGAEIEELEYLLKSNDIEVVSYK
ncbi:glycyl-radical enzyme activating protein [Pectinatus haikarae]|uniref:Pyruvate formate lyase activating enzyme n=2 Tax=Pectinatus haikarae TaxID=349096 RepID=A0ABT9Y9H0_9FIRM|nr:glycyl-radical enzyme activating protein [Pectinatus haikarae]MDQ0203832.1 pyruvate formate lyase activating enzyme [Pectinatus haikarae]